jgi:hypothetical protein
MPTRLDIALQRNENWARTVSIVDDQDIALDLTGCVLAKQVRDKLAQSLITSASIAVLDPTSREVQMTLRASEGSALAAYGNAIQPAILPFDCRLTDPDGVSVVLFTGNIILSRGETSA